MFVTTSQPDISVWVQACREGDELAFRQIYDHLHQELFAFLSARARTRDDAKELLQELMLDLWHALGRFRYRSDKQFYAFVYKLARRKLAKHHDRFTPEVEVKPHHATAMHSFDDLPAVQRLLTSLPEKLRVVIELRYIVDLPFAQIAARLGEKETTVKVRHHRAIRKLATFIQSYEQA